MKPLLKWAGGKRHIASTLEAHLPEGWNSGTYFEPFLGGAAFFLHLEPNLSHLSDINPALVQFYKDVQVKHLALVEAIQEIASKFDSQDEEGKKKFFLDLRSEFNLSSPSLQNSARFYALNKLCFNGLYRENRKGEFNVPFGQKKVFPIIPLSDFAKVSSALVNTTVELADFERTAALATEGDFIYFDPPYLPLTETSSFTSYSSEGFGLAAQERLAQTMLTLRERGVKAMLSNSSSVLTAEIYKGLRQITISAPRMVSAKSSSRGAVDELLIMNY